MNLTQKEISTVAVMLMADNDQDVVAALNYLGTHTSFIQSLADELVVVYVFNENLGIQELAGSVLSHYYSEGELQRIHDAFKIFDFIAETRPSLPAHIIVPLFGKYDMVRDRYEQLIFTNKHYSNKYIELGKLLTPIPELVEIAQILFETVIKFNPEEPEGYSFLGIIYQYMYQDHEKALQLLEKSRQLDDENLEVHLNLGHLKEVFFHRVADALFHYERSTELDPQDIRGYIKLANTHYYYSKEYERSKQYIDIILSMEPENDTALALLGSIYWKVENNNRRALTTFDRGLSSGKPSALLTASLAELYVEGEADFERGRIFYQQSLELEPGHRWRFEKMKELLMRRFSDYGGVKECYENYLEEEPYDADMHYEFAHFILEYIHIFPLAKSHLNKAIQLNPNHDAAKELLGQLS